jgi:hypothetical protein
MALLKHHERGMRYDDYVVYSKSSDSKDITVYGPFSQLSIAKKWMMEQAKIIADEYGWKIKYLWPKVDDAYTIVDIIGRNGSVKLEIVQILPPSFDAIDGLSS